MIKVEQWDLSLSPEEYLTIVKKAHTICSRYFWLLDELDELNILDNSFSSYVYELGANLTNVASYGILSNIGVLALLNKNFKTMNFTQWCVYVEKLEKQLYKEICQNISIGEKEFKKFMKKYSF